MLKCEGARDQVSGQPRHRLADNVAAQVGQILTHPDVKGPRGEALSPHVVRQLNKTEVIEKGIDPDVGIDQERIPEQELTKGQKADDQVTIEYRRQGESLSGEATLGRRGG